MALESFHWDDHFETGLDAVDQEHRVLVDLINRFGKMLTQAERPAPGQIEAPGPTVTEPMMTAPSMT